MRRISAVLAAASLIASAAPYATAQPAPRLGIVLLHGKRGLPGYLSETKSALERQGYIVSTPEMCWSERRQYDHVKTDCLAEIDAVIADLKRRGARAIVVAGHSLGGSAAIAYGAAHDGLAGVIGIAAGDAFWGQPALFPEIGRAQRLVDDGKGDKIGDFVDLRESGNSTMRTTAVHFLSFVRPVPGQMMPGNASRLRAPLLIVVGERDAMTLEYDSRTFDAARPDSLNRFVRVDADHNSVVRVGVKPMLEWLARIAATAPSLSVPKQNDDVCNTAVTRLAASSTHSCAPEFCAGAPCVVRTDRYD